MTTGVLIAVAGVLLAAIGTDMGGGVLPALIGFFLFGAGCVLLARELARRRSRGES